MAKANLVLPDGTKVTIDGSPDEITKILGTFGAGAALGAGAKRGTGQQSGQKGRRPRTHQEGPTSFILELRDEGFFKVKRSLNEIVRKLEERGRIYARTTLSPILVKLVRRKDLRRIKDGKRWAYVS